MRFRVWGAAFECFGEGSQVGGDKQIFFFYKCLGRMGLFVVYVEMDF